MRLKEVLVREVLIEMLAKLIIHQQPVALSYYFVACQCGILSASHIGIFS